MPPRPGCDDRGPWRFRRCVPGGFIIRPYRPAPGLLVGADAHIGPAIRRTGVPQSASPPNAMRHGVGAAESMPPATRQSADFRGLPPSNAVGRHAHMPPWIGCECRGRPGSRQPWNEPIDKPAGFCYYEVVTCEEKDQYGRSRPVESLRWVQGGGRPARIRLGAAA